MGATGIAGLIDIAFDPAGNLFASDVVTDSLVTLNTMTGASSLVAGIGPNLDFAPGISVDFDTGTLCAAFLTGGGTTMPAVRRGMRRR